MNKVTAEARQRDSAVILFGPGDYCALTVLIPFRWFAEDFPDEVPDGL